MTKAIIRGTFWGWSERIDSKREPYKTKFVSRALGINESSLRRIREGEIKIPYWLRQRIDDLFEDGEGQSPHEAVPAITEVPIEALPPNLEEQHAAKRAKIRAEQAERMKEVRKLSPHGHPKSQDEPQLGFGEPALRVPPVNDEARKPPPATEQQEDMTIHLLTKLLAQATSSSSTLLNAVHANGNIAEAQRDDVLRSLVRLANIGQDIVEQILDLKEVMVALAKGRPAANGEVKPSQPDVTYHGDGSRTIHQHEAEVTESCFVPASEL